jgi:pimeloyl-ACP methyl ester carboxylesterase
MSRRQIVPRRKPNSHAARRTGDGVGAIIGEAMSRAKTVMVPRGHHYVFISHPDLVEREMRAFLTRD